MSSSRTYDYLFKIILIGENGVGKSCLLTRFACDFFPEGYHATIEIDFRIKTIELDGKVIKLQIWDTYHGERCRYIKTSYFRGTRGTLLVYSMSDQNSFEGVDHWLDQLHRYGIQDMSTVLVGNKCDQENVVSYDLAREFAKSQNIPLIETSAKDGTNVEQAFIMLTAQMVDKCESGTEDRQINQSACGFPSSAGGTSFMEGKCCLS